MSLGLLGSYGSDSDISDSDEEVSRPPTDAESKKWCSTVNNETTQVQSSVPSGSGDPLNFTASTESDDQESSSDSNYSSPNSPSSHTDTTQPPLHLPSLPLPDLDNLISSASAGGNTLTGDGNKEQQFDKTNSVFYNPYKEAEEARLSILKKHVTEFTEAKPVRVRERKRRRKLRTEVRSNDPNRHLQSGHNERVHHHQSHGPLLSTPGAEATMNPYTGVGGHYPSGFSTVDISEDGPGSDRTVSGSKKKRSGVGESLMPAKKFMKTYKVIQAQERPWTVAPK